MAGDLCNGNFPKCIYKGKGYNKEILPEREIPGLDGEFVCRYHTTLHIRFQTSHLSTSPG